LIAHVYKPLECGSAEANHCGFDFMVLPNGRHKNCTHACEAANRLLNVRPRATAVHSGKRNFSVIYITLANAKAEHLGSKL
jgi:hypothetical protein